MRNIKNDNKKGFLKKAFIKLCRILGYEIIDQNNFYFPVSEVGAERNLSTLGERAISLGLGETKIKRPVKSLDIILKTCTSVNLVTQSKKRIFEKNKSEYTLRTINSLLSGVKFNKEVFEKIDLKITQYSLDALNVDEHGLDEMDNRILTTIIDKFKGGPVGLTTISTAVGEQAGTIEEVYEPFLIMEGYLMRTPRGRRSKHCIISKIHT